MLDNSGDSPLQVPGFGGIPLDYERPGKDQFATINDWAQRPAVTRRVPQELADHERPHTYWIDEIEPSLETPDWCRTEL